MALDVERTLIAKIVATRNFNDVQDARIGLEHFDQPMNRKLFRLIQDHKVAYGNVPDLQSIQRNYPTADLPDCEQYALDYLIDEIQKDRLARILSDGMVESSGLLTEKKPQDAFDVLGLTLREASSQTGASHVIEDLTTRLDEDWRAELRERRKRDNWLLGVPSGFESIDRATKGFQRQQLITFVGTPKAGKSTLLLLAAMNAHKAAHVPLFVGFEMSVEEQRYRHAAWLVRMSHERLLTGSLSQEEQRRFDRAIRSLNATVPFHMVSDPRSATTITGLQTLIEQLEPDIVYVDGVYMMRDEEGEDPNSSRALTNITRGLKRLAQGVNIPIVLSTQALTSKIGRGKSLTADAVGYSSSFRQDSDVLIGVEKTEVDEINMVSILDARSAKPMSVYLRWDWETGVFEELEGNPLKPPDEASTRAQSGF